MAPIYITDDDPDARFIVAEILKTNGYNVLAAGGGAEVPQRLRVPLALPRDSGIEPGDRLHVTPIDAPMPTLPRSRAFQ